MSAQLAPQLNLREAIAPPERRGIARDGVQLLVTDRLADRHEHARFFDLPLFVKPGDLFVVNDSATVPAALRARRENGETLMLHVSTMIDEQLWTVEPRGLVSAGERLSLEAGGTVTMIAPTHAIRSRIWYARFDLPVPMYAFLANVGEPIRYGYMKERFPLSDYQTIFARKPGSVEMPSAGRPFTENVVRALRRRGAGIASITLHCGVASFEAPEIPPPERFVVSPQTAERVNRTREGGGRVVAVGTTVVRALESAIHQDRVIAASGWTDLVIDPSSSRKATDALITGFHPPTATHIAMLRSFLPDNQLGDAYREAAYAGYYCHEFGDIHAIF